MLRGKKKNHTLITINNSDVTVSGSDISMMFKGNWVFHSVTVLEKKLYWYDAVNGDDMI